MIKQYLQKKSIKPPILIVITGPTASGKSGLAVEIAKKFNGEVVSADSRQVYKGLDIGSGKITKKEMKGVVHHCLDIVSPKKVFTAGDFKVCAEKAIEDILSHGKVPIICGGTAFYIDTLLGEMPSLEIPPDWELRKKLEKKTASQLFAILLKLKSERAANIDAKNPRRLIRAIEIAKNTLSTQKDIALLDPRPMLAAASRPFSRRRAPKGSSNATSFCFDKHNVLKLGIKVPQKILDKKIKKRLDERFKIGMIEEVENLHKAGVSWKRLFDLGLEYRWISLFLRGKMTRAEMERKLFTEIRRYSKRQITWLKRDKKIKWIKPLDKTRGKPKIKKTATLVRKFLSKN